MSATSTPKRPPSTGAAITSKKPPGTPASNNSSRMAADSNGSATRSTAASATAATSATSVARARSVRNTTGTPVSARAAARKPTITSTTDSTALDDADAKAELQAKLDDAQEKLREAERACAESQKHATVLQVRLDEAVTEQGLLEERAHENAERVEELEAEKKEQVRARRELEQIYEADRVQMVREREEAQAKEEELQSAMVRLKETLSQKEMRDRTAGLTEEDRRQSLSRNGSFRSGNVSPNPETGQFAPSSLQRSDSRSSSRLVMQKDKIIEGLRLELAEAQIKLVELENQGGGRVHELQREIYEIKMQNARLMEENESFQLLLSEKTLNGDLAQSDLLRTPSRSRVGGASLADELEAQQDDDSELPDGTPAPDRRAQAELSSLKDQNKALTLYINNIISRLLQHEQFEQILDKTPDLMAGPAALSRKYALAEAEKDLPPPPPPKDGVLHHGDDQQLDDGAAGGFLQRARSVIGPRSKQRPTSIYHLPARQGEPGEHARVNENPDTAPRIPLGRSGSTRGHRRAVSEWPSANVVNNMMYRGPSPGLHGPISPGLTSPNLTGRTSFFSPAGMAGRLPSHGSGPAPAEQPPPPQNAPELNKENLPLSSPSLSSNNTPPSTSHHRASLPSTDSEPRPPSSSAATSVLAAVSPPRSTTSSGERVGEGSRPSGAIMMGSKPRPLRLVQEATAADEEKARKAGNRTSWFGWMGKGVPGVGGIGGIPGSGGGSTS